MLQASKVGWNLKSPQPPYTPPNLSFSLCDSGYTKHVWMIE